MASGLAVNVVGFKGISGLPARFTGGGGFDALAFDRPFVSSDAVFPGSDDGIGGAVAA